MPGSSGISIPPLLYPRDPERQGDAEQHTDVFIFCQNRYTQAHQDGDDIKGTKIRFLCHLRRQI